ncbi:MAG: uracil-DNA glycosylase [Nitrospinaceae bacterium]|nr:uracil-DNA glycosylase [Nitrospinaceae bacterium]NIR57384.1 uracil-DNA glycosylase [Nitrospinaceae bacterium]NIS87836.1 uracil-DNA glycosylase [Nitrospinaceae bacterium]NIT84706.1 uracil-DNA glycosylase [Nitrospinaceae bacterium]NIU46885.1 uracil-DNA glycosylase [Nitrospinaceae bacterium]
MVPHVERKLLLRQLKNYLVFLRETGETHIPLKNELGDLPVMVKPGGTFHDHTTLNNQTDMTSASIKNQDPGDPVQRLSEIRQEMGDCQRCKLCEGRKNIVFGSGNPNADLVFVGEGPGADEDEQGLPFVGRAGKKLTEIIEKGMLLDREKDTYICNIVKCRPPGNRDPEREEVDACEPFLIKQLKAIQPKVIVALGKPAASTLLGRSVPITKERGTWHEFEGMRLMLTYHPAYLLRAYTLENRRAVHEDMQKVLEVLNT